MNNASNETTGCKNNTCFMPVQMFINDNQHCDREFKQENIVKHIVYEHCDKKDHEDQKCCCEKPEMEQTHTLEVLGSLMIAEPEEDPHNHRFATVSSQEIPFGHDDHYHEVMFRTDFYENHFHEAWGRTTGAIQVGDRHVHFLYGVTTINDGHYHRYRVATLIDDPIGE
jgi:hypothetical protein